MRIGNENNNRLVLPEAKFRSSPGLLQNQMLCCSLTKLHDMIRQTFLMKLYVKYTYNDMKT